jgi:uncharacterized protein (TIGR02145 family)
MKKIFTLLASSFFLRLVLNAQEPAPVAPPLAFSYKATIIKPGGSIVANKTIGLKISILKGSANNPVAGYTEIFRPTTNEYGQIDIIIGGGVGFSSIEWSNDKYYLKTEVDVKGGTAYQLMSTTQFLSVPYAMYAAQAGFALKVDYNNLSNKPDLFSGDYNELTDKPGNGTSLGEMLYWNGSSWVPMSAGSDGQTLTVHNGIPAWVSGRLSDIDGNVYKTVKIGTQVWMAENLKTTRYNNGDPIGTTIPANLFIADEISPKYQWAYGGIENNAETYGRLYTWYAATDTRKVCPAGWHVPTDDEWTSLTSYLGNINSAGGKMKEQGTIHWTTPNTGATNESGFTALPGGYRLYLGSFVELGNFAFYWSSTTHSEINAWSKALTYDYELCDHAPNHKNHGYSVRCLKD